MYERLKVICHHCCCVVPCCVQQCWPVETALPCPRRFCSPRTASAWSGTRSIASGQACRTLATPASSTRPCSVLPTPPRSPTTCCPGSTPRLVRELALLLNSAPQHQSNCFDGVTHLLIKIVTCFYVAANVYVVNLCLDLCNCVSFTVNAVLFYRTTYWLTSSGEP